MADSVATFPLPHSENLLIINQYYYAEDACVRNAPTKLPIQDIDIDARHGPLRLLIHSVFSSTCTLAAYSASPSFEGEGEPGRFEGPSLSLQST